MLRKNVYPKKQFEFVMTSHSSQPNFDEKCANEIVFSGELNTRIVNEIGKSGAFSETW